MAIVLGLVLVGSITADVVLNDGVTLLFLGKKLADLIEWLAFWR